VSTTMTWTWTWMTELTPTPVSGPPDAGLTPRFLAVLDVSISLDGTASLGLVAIAGILLLTVVVWATHRRQQRRQQHRQQERERMCQWRQSQQYRAQLAARRLQQEAFRVQANMLRHAMQHMDGPQHPHQRPGGRHG